MSIHNYLLSGYKFKKAKALALEGRLAEGGQSDQLFQQAYDNFSAISKSYSNYSDAIYSWGFALLNQAQKKPAAEAIKVFEEAIDKFSFCKTIAPQHLGAAVDGGVALLGLAKSKQVGLDDDLYGKVKESFDAAEVIQAGSASYNLACLYALKNNSDACLEALELAREHGLLPDEQDIINDDDLQNVKSLPWFDEFILSLAEEEEEPEPEPENEVSQENQINDEKAEN